MPRSHPRKMKHAASVPLPYVPMPRPALVQRRSDGPELLMVTLSIPRQAGDATLAAIEEIRNVIGTRLERPAEYAREESLTHAALGLGALSAGLRNAGCREDWHYAN